MIRRNNKVIIGVDHGYGYTKTASTIMKSGVEELVVEPPFNEDILLYNDQVFAVGQKRTEQTAEKTKTQEYYILTLAAIASELKNHNITKVNDLILAAGLPYSFMSRQAESFKKYLRKNKYVEFRYEGKKYSIGIKDVKVFPQGFPMITSEITATGKESITVADIGSRTIDVLSFSKGKPIYDKCFSIDRRGTLDCIAQIQKYYLSSFQENIDEEDIQQIFQNKAVYLPDENVKFVKKLIKAYATDIQKQLEAKDVKHNVVFCGGGAVVIKNYGKSISETSEINDDIYGNAKGYEKLAYNLVQ